MLKTEKNTRKQYKPENGIRCVSVWWFTNKLHTSHIFGTQIFSTHLLFCVLIRMHKGKLDWIGWRLAAAFFSSLLCFPCIFSWNLGQCHFHEIKIPFWKLFLFQTNDQTEWAGERSLDLCCCCCYSNFFFSLVDWKCRLSLGFFFGAVWRCNKIKWCAERRRMKW